MRRALLAPAAVLAVASSAAVTAAIPAETLAPAPAPAQTSPAPAGGVAPGAAQAMSPKIVMVNADGTRRETGGSQGCFGTDGDAVLAALPPNVVAVTYSEYGCKGQPVVGICGQGVAQALAASAPVSGTPAATGTPAFPAPAIGTPAAFGTPAFGTPALGTPVIGTPAAFGTPAFGTPALSTPVIGTPAAFGTPALGTPVMGTPATVQAGGPTGVSAANVDATDGNAAADAGNVAGGAAPGFDAAPVPQFGIAPQMGTIGCTVAGAAANYGPAARAFSSRLDAQRLELERYSGMQSVRMPQALPIRSVYLVQVGPSAQPYCPPAVPGPASPLPTARPAPLSPQPPQQAATFPEGAATPTGAAPAVPERPVARTAAPLQPAAPTPAAPQPAAPTPAAPQPAAPTPAPATPQPAAPTPAPQQPAPGAAPASPTPAA